jgi:hypothetical protein
VVVLAAASSHLPQHPLLPLHLATAVAAVHGESRLSPRPHITTAT